MDLNDLDFKPSITKSIAKKPLCLTTCDNLLYLLFSNINKIEIEVYDIKTTCKKATIFISEISNPSGFAANNWFLLIITLNSKMCCVNLKYIEFDSWCIPYSKVDFIVSLTNHNFMIVTDNKMVEYHAKGTHVRDIILPSTIGKISEISVFDDEQILISHYRTFGEDNHCKMKMNFLSIVNSKEEILMIIGNHYRFNLTMKINNVPHCIMSNSMESIQILDNNLKFVNKYNLIFTNPDSKYKKECLNAVTSNNVIICLQKASKSSNKKDYYLSFYKISNKNSK